ncbi:hypothetical protein CMI46_03215 [Candidatus Pacearchaeota archaeon]|nr:hypothetical protein [Candidatus Pacearchaeota archaeon]|tara:strand:+ start:51 stop:275 length:225 start_codon:yes stop_codon:yes gene_type:complete
MGKLFNREEVRCRLEEQVRENGNDISFEFVNDLAMELKGDKRVDKIVVSGIKGSIVSVLYDMGYCATFRGYRLV